MCCALFNDLVHRTKVLIGLGEGIHTTASIAAVAAAETPTAATSQKQQQNAMSINGSVKSDGQQQSAEQVERISLNGN